MENVSRRLLGRARLSREAMDAALSLSGLRPSVAEWRDFGILVMRFAGVLSLAAGMIFLIAFNWDNLGQYGRFAIVELPLLAALAIAWIKGLHCLPGKLALMMAVLLTGGLLALFGQTYQTGADVYELFFGWAALVLPWVMACRYAPCWALWLLLLNTGITLYSGTWAHSWLFRLFPENWDWSPWFLPCLLNLLLYVTVVSLARWPELGLSESWLRRGLMAVAMAFATFCMMYRITGGRHSEGMDAGSFAEILLFLGASAAFAAHAYARKEDLFNFAVLALSWIAVTTTLIGRSMLDTRDWFGAMLFLGLYVLGTSAGAVRAISYLGRQWRTGEAAQ